MNGCVVQLIAREENKMCHAFAYALTLDDGSLKSSRGAKIFYVCRSTLNEERAQRSIGHSLIGRQAEFL